MKQWQYFQDVVPTDRLDEHLAKIGEAGWELVNALPAKTMTLQGPAMVFHLFCKREIVPEPANGTGERLFQRG